MNYEDWCIYICHAFICFMSICLTNRRELFSPRWLNVDSDSDSEYFIYPWGEIVLLQMKTSKRQAHGGKVPKAGRDKQHVCNLRIIWKRQTQGITMKDVL